MLSFDLRGSRNAANALIFPELASRNTSFEYFVDLFQCAPFDFWEIEVEPDGGDEARRSPDVTVLRTYKGVILKASSYTMSEQNLPQFRALGLMK